MKKKGLLCIVLAIMMVAMLTTTALAAPDGWAKNSKGQWSYSLNNKNVTGWKQIKGKWYLFNSKGIMLTGWQKDSKGVWYYMNPSGDMVANKWVKSGSSWYYLQASGAMKTGWLNDKGTWYYLDKSSGAMKTGWVKDGGTWWFFNKSTGAMQDGWIQDGKNWYYVNYIEGMLTGWVVDGDGDYYYLDPVSGAMQTGWANIDGYDYYFDKDGILQWDDEYEGDFPSRVWIEVGSGYFHAHNGCSNIHSGTPMEVPTEDAMLAGHEACPICFDYEGEAVG